MMFVELFMCIFSTVYTFYIKYYKFFYPLPEQLFSYNDGRVLIHGYIGYNKVFTAIEFFELDGTYKILINDKLMRTYNDGAIIGSDPTKTYVLHGNNSQCQVNTKVIIKDIIMDNEVGFDFDAGDIINFIELVKQM